MDKDLKNKGKEDRIGRYLQKSMKEFVFAELSTEYMKKCGADGFMKNVPVPFREEDLKAAKEGKGLATIRISENMAFVMGIDPKFSYGDKYMHFIELLWGGKFCDGLVQSGVKEAEQGNFETACIYLRACLRMEPDNLEAMYTYALICREIYLAAHEHGRDDEYIGRFKAEAMEYFEQTTIEYPDFAEPYFYLGYAYLNMGMYGKAEASWKEFMRLTDPAIKESCHCSHEHDGEICDCGHHHDDGEHCHEREDGEHCHEEHRHEHEANSAREIEQRTEISARLREIADPVQIEKGYTAIISGRYEQGIELLEAFQRGKFDRWWPLYYYLGMAYARTGRFSEAEKSLQKVLSLNASHIDTMKELAELYKTLGDEVNMHKYLKKIELITSQN